ncbi:Nisin biosynthesis protein NisB [Polaribacter huanghezhanensis]|uniref:lantibiotic dehydratase family protein n=1 Tax=Polaribacter huanghezhanensis TaxID=1354726 RepID=UPI002647EAD4|nr:lantibiotic dehydratase family protein [Polaribacter huanghezhanensis]WKD85074.1 Nisin biosynthesis protein NisB [Polaribacter huanghezhanensis]
MLIPYNIFNSYCLRTPLFSISFIQNIYKKNSIEDEDYFELLKNKLFVEAIFLASPDLYFQIKKWKTGALKDFKKTEKLKISILKYATRISTRCTPFGLFATCSVGEFSKEIKIELNPIQDYQRITRFDMSFLSLLVNELLKDNQVKERLKFYPNTSLYKVGDHYRYIEYTLKDNKRSYTVEGIVLTTYLEEVLKKVADGKTILELTMFLSKKEITIKEANSFINELIINQILVSELGLKITGEDFFSDLVHKLPKNSKIKNELLDLQLHLNRLDDKFGNSIDHYKEIIEKAKNKIPELKSKHLLQTDSFSSFKENTLGFKIKKQLKKAFTIFNKITNSPTNSNLDEFKRNFRSRYEENEMSLNFVLDAEIGIGFGKKQTIGGYLIDDLNTEEARKNSKDITWSSIDILLFDKYTEAIKNDDYSVLLIDDDFKGFPENWNDLPDTFSGIAEIYSNQECNKIFINGVSGSTATNLLGRFGHGNKELRNHLNEIVQVEEELNPNKILAEIIHLPEARTGNVLQRPTIRKHEIPYLGNSSVHKDCQISIEDILISMRGNQIILKSKSFKKEILPRLGNAHNYKGNSLPLYHFLCELQTDNKRGSIGFRWNSIFLNNTFLPRVEYEDLIFSKARWNIKVSDIGIIFEPTITMSEVVRWRGENKIPQFVELVEGDNKLLINLNNQSSLRMLKESVKKKKRFVLEEFLFGEKEIVNCNNQESFCNQFVISFYNEAKLKANKSGWKEN